MVGCHACANAYSNASKMVSLNYLDGVLLYNDLCRPIGKRHSGRVPGAGEIYRNLAGTL